ncbi:conserved hypothetical protein [Culex quinquefasciatus]|uniref:Uncharacterized protein n=1 Tax=Culex quinquefasciatus TaxID=7176 RepID=B0XJ53_CULQU|nr:conserved hypothetical protein [Culex quinquefasciatus]|eukprot:XP_001869675.1 conserved hypothetical protein [Culex quinquefasciatus]
MFKNPPPLSRVPGDPSRSRDSEKQGYIRDISKLSKTELLDLKLRQELLLNNKGRVAKLPDKGAKIRLFYEQIVKQLEAHCNVDRAAELFSELNIASVGKRSLTKLEWSARTNVEPALQQRKLANVPGRVPKFPRPRFPGFPEPEVVHSTIKEPAPVLFVTSPAPKTPSDPIELPAITATKKQPQRLPTDFQERPPGNRLAHLIQLDADKLQQYSLPVLSEWSRNRTLKGGRPARKSIKKKPRLGSSIPSRGKRVTPVKKTSLTFAIFGTSMNRIGVQKIWGRTGEAAAEAMQNVNRNPLSPVYRRQ